MDGDCVICWDIRVLGLFSLTTSSLLNGRLGFRRMSQGASYVCLTFFSLVKGILKARSLSPQQQTNITNLLLAGRGRPTVVAVLCLKVSKWGRQETGYFHICVCLPFFYGAKGAESVIGKFQ